MSLLVVGHCLFCRRPSAAGGRSTVFSNLQAGAGMTQRFFGIYKQEQMTQRYVQAKAVHTTQYRSAGAPSKHQELVMKSIMRVVVM